MARKFLALLVMSCALGFVVAGCGGDDEDANSGGSAPATQTEDSSGGTAPAGGGNEAAAKAAREGCEAGIRGNAAIDASKQEELAKECEKVGEAAASGDKDQFKEAYTSYCNKLAEALPAEAQQAAKDGCLQGANALG